METVRELVERLHAKYAQICNIPNKTALGVIACQNLWVEDYEYDKDEKAVYIWIY